MANFIRGVLAVVAGCLAAMSAMVVCESMGHAIFPPPPGLDPSKPVALETYARGMRPVEFLPVLFGWAAGTLIGSSVAAKLAATWKVGYGIVVGGLLLLGGLPNLIMIPHPIWVWILALLIFPFFTTIGSVLGSAGSIDGPSGVANRA